MPFSCSQKAVAGSVLTNSTAKQLPDQFDELDSEAVAGYGRHQRLSVASWTYRRLVTTAELQTLFID